MGRRYALGNALPHCCHPLREGRRATARFGLPAGGHVGSLEGVQRVPPSPVLLVAPASRLSGDDRPPERRDGYREETAGPVRPDVRLVASSARRDAGPIQLPGLYQWAAG